MKLSPHEIYWLATQEWTPERYPGYYKNRPDTPNYVRYSWIATAICLAESGGDTDIMARSNSGPSLGQRAHGLPQISGEWQGDKIQKTPSWRDPRVAMNLMHQVFVGAGKSFSPWDTYTNAAYQVKKDDGTGYPAGQWVASFNEFLPDAKQASKFPWPPSY